MTYPRMDEHESEAARRLPAMHFVTWTAQPGGMESYITAYVERSRGRQHSHLFSLRPSENRLSDLVDGYEQGSASNPLLYLRFFRYCWRHRKDRMHLLNAGPIILGIALLAGLRSPVYHIHGTRYWKGPIDRLVQRTAWWMVRPFAVRFIANSMHSAEVFLHLFRMRPVVVYNGFHTAALIATRRQRTRLLRMGYAGRMAPGKNTRSVLDLFHAVADMHEGLELHLAGSGPEEEELRKVAAAGPHRERIHFHGWVTDMPAFYGMLDLMIFPSSHESFGNVLAEALINGLPVLTSDLPAFREIHGDPDTFSLGAPEDPQAFLRNFRNAITRYDTIARKAHAIADRVAAKFDMSAHLDAIEHIHGPA